MAAFRVVALQRPNQTAATAFAPDQPKLALQPARPLGAGSVVREGECVSQLAPRSARGMDREMMANGGFKLHVAHRRDGSGNLMMPRLKKDHAHQTSGRARQI